MRPKIYLLNSLPLLLLLLTGRAVVYSQPCAPVTATYISSESRCVSTGSIQIFASGGSGNYQYKVSGPLITGYSASNLITGLLPGRYLVTIKDVASNCVYPNDSVTVAGSYTTPNFNMVATNTTCPGVANGSITVTSEQFGRAPFSYQIIAPSASGVGTVSVAGYFPNLIDGNYLVQLSDSCGALQTRSIVVPVFGWKIDNFTVAKNCDTINVVINLKDDNGNVTPNPVFDGFLYGVLQAPGDTVWHTSNSFSYTLNHRRSVTLIVRGPCGVTKKVVWTDLAVPALDPLAVVTNLGCTGFTAFVTGAINFSLSTQFCLYTSNNVLENCNTTGVFNNIPYGSHCIKAIDNCYDTIITRCFSAARPVPAVDLLVQIIANCSDFTALITGQVNLSDPNYCIYNNSNVLVSCNSTGVFTALPFGSYCIKITNNPICYDTVITRCFTVAQPVPAGGVVVITNQTCTSFTATVSGALNVNNPQYCLYTAANVLVACNTTGVFDNLPFGTYCIDLLNNTACYDTVITTCFTVLLPVPAVNNVVDIRDKTCFTFTAKITGQVGLVNPLYCLYNSNDVLISCNANGTFTGIPYGSYCIKIQNDPACFDTLIIRCFTVLNNGVPVVFNATSVKSCTLIGGTDITVNITAGSPTYIIQLFTPGGVLAGSAATVGNNTNYTFLGIPGLPPGIPYKIIVTDFCGNKDSLNILPVISIVERKKTVILKCPSGTWSNGSADIIFDISNNNIGGSIKPKIIKKDGVNTTINPSSNIGYVYTFSDLGPGIYIFSTRISNCSNKDVFDTVTVGPYTFPDLLRSAAYNCDNSSISVGASVTGGVPPFTYEIIGSYPLTPNINTGPQSNPVFNINNGTAYSLIRLRATDACGNAALNDVGVLPLADVSIHAGFDCFYVGLTLSADTIPNTTYKWYKKISAVDSVLVGTDVAYTIPYLMPPDTGRYVCVCSVNNGCLSRTAFYTVTGSCMGGILPVSVSLSGRMNQRGMAELDWLAYNEAGVKEYRLERSKNAFNGFQFVSVINARNNGNHLYTSTDVNLLNGNNYYRLKIVGFDQSVKYSNIVLIRNSSALIAVYPNPVREMLNISIPDKNAAGYAISITDLMGRTVFSARSGNIQNTILQFPRNRVNTGPGVCILSVLNLKTGSRYSEKIIIQ